MFFDIQIGGAVNFLQEEWREAILHYLFGIWAGKLEVILRPKIAFGPITLLLDQTKGVYYAYGVNQEDQPPAAPSLSKEEILMVTQDQKDVEIGLIRFVKDNRIKLLMITFSGHGIVTLWKKTRRGQYGISAINIPRSHAEYEDSRV